MFFSLIIDCDGNLKVYKYNQKLDHFHPHNNITFQQKLVVNNNQWSGAKLGAPIFALLGDMKTDPYSIDEYDILNLCAIEFKALLIYIEVV